ncbi:MULTISPECIES: aldehyde dehydrogenase [Rhizobium/Agrobacterium group]|uniref:aldehyde dehydrogenase n=1 Tax=Rhizobium/Agrobacterium group TaxID=227290 RepID=UPI00023A5B55|nr:MULTISPECIES: aldehyde dehydrogenase [Rhizobium/Agrobacterium group]AHK03615.1 aldehyde dehydrogenase [Agrobacterium tumefaciens LBA4213 (Ach5)]AKC09377.1 aldehyde dehydrogenase [Agrobacterium tumefaciens]EHK00381.1 aldehyde dehydrogenase [Agrobacterium tumefaciens 5A]AYM18520.1 aldehyde dehydrogenase [Agrobacterium tumefaciens]AYM69819.1 aldehyde dehydrogenase [Agrobacterium tumefaciens]
MRRFQCYIDGRFEDGEASFSSLDPATGEPWAEMPESREADISRAVEAAHRALYDDAAWSKLTATQRGKLLYRLADLVAENAKTLAELETRDTGKIIRETSAQIAYVADYYRYYAGLADKIEGAYLPIDKPDMDVWLRREPVGVVAAIVPWNSQLFLAAVKIGPALAAGCTIVIKASEDGPAPLLEFARLVQEAGFPAGVVNIVTGFGASCGTALTTHPKVAHIAFTGGPETARHIVRNSAENLASTSLELGGKSPILVFADADLESAANAQVAGIFAATGQSCVAGSRLIVERSVKDRFLGILKAKAEAIRIGSPLDMATEVGPLATERQRKHIVSLVSASEKAGAKVVTGGVAVDGAGYFYPPTILDCDGIRSPSMEREFFGPVLSVVSFETEAEAIALANDTVYGLASGVFTQNLTRAHRLMKAIRAGVVWVNTYRAVSPIAPFGGFGLSGDGREGGLAAALDYTRTKTIWLRTSDDPIPDPFVMR